MLFLVTPKREVERKKQGVLRREFFGSNFEVERENCVVVHMRHFDIGFYFFVFSQCFFLNSFPNLFILGVLFCFLEVSFFQFSLPFDHFSFYINHDFHVPLMTYLTHCCN